MTDHDPKYDALAAGTKKDPHWDARPYTLARAFLRDTEERIVHWRSAFFWFRRARSCYLRMDPEHLAAQLTRYLNAVYHHNTGGATVHLNVKRALVGDVMMQLAAICQEKLDGIPSWIDPRGQPEPENIVAFERTGLVDVARLFQATDAGEMYLPIPPTDNWFSESSIPCAYDPTARCLRWLRHLAESIADPESIALLQEWIGYLLVMDNSLQAMLWLQGKPGSGKSTVSRVIEEVVGKTNIASFALGDLNEAYTLASWMGKTLAVSEDADLPADADGRRILEILKVITGGGGRAVNRKFKDILENVRFKARIMMIVNTFPPLPDTADALRRRSLIIPFQEPVAKENIIANLADQIIAQELPGIVAWAMVGLRRLRERSMFPETDASTRMLRRMSALTSPLTSFVRDVVMVDAPEIATAAATRVTKVDLYGSYKLHAAATGHRALSRERFIEGFLSLVPGARVVVRKDGQELELEGFALREGFTVGNSSGMSPTWW